MIELGFLAACAATLGSAIAWRRWPRSRKWLWAGPVVVLLVHGSLYWQYTVDDAFIFFRYAHNWASSLGPVFQAGDRVEGFTSFFWVAVLALADRAGFDLECTSKIFGACGAVLTLLGAHSLAVRLCSPGPGGDGRSGLDTAWAALVAPYFLAISPLFASWMCAGMEAPFFAAVITWATVCLIDEESERREVPWSALLFGLSVLVRPEGMLLGFLTFCVLVLSGPGRRRAPGWAGLFGLVAVTFWLCRWSYYGSFFPNTFLAKTGTGLERFSSGLTGLRDLGLDLGPLFVAFSLLALPALRHGRTPQRAVIFPVAGFLGYVAWTGGDVLHLRFFIHIFGLLAACIAAGVHEFVALSGGLLGRLSGRCRLCIFVFVSLEGILVGYSRDARAFRVPEPFGAGYVVNGGTSVQKAILPLGRWLRDNVRPGSLLATWDVGGLGHLSGLPIIDMCGLTDRTVALLIRHDAPRSRFLDYLRERRPELIVPYYVEDKAWGPRLLPDARDWLERNYRFHSAWMGGPDGYGLGLYVRRDVSLPPVRMDPPGTGSLPSVRPRSRKAEAPKSPGCGSLLTARRPPEQGAVSEAGHRHPRLQRGSGDRADRRAMPCCPRHDRPGHPCHDGHRHRRLGRVRGQHRRAGEGVRA